MKRFKQDSLERQLSRLENEVSDDFYLLQEGGVDYFTTEELRDLHLSWRLRFQLFERFHYLSLGFGVASPILFLISLTIQQIGMTTYATKVFWLSPFCTVIFLVGQFFLRKKFKNRDTIASYGKIIQDELQKRKKQRDASFF